jgi:hypothetical protein
VSVTDLTAWNPCATCNCGPWCFARCCVDHTDREHTEQACGPDRLCCDHCPERWHPDHPDGIDCAQTVPVLPPLPKRPLADMRIEVVKRELNQGALSGLNRQITNYAAHLVIAALDSFDEEVRKAEFRRGFELGVANERVRQGLPPEDPYVP